MQSRKNSKVAWISLFAVISFLLGNYGLYDVIGLTNESFQTLLNLIFATLTAFGVWNNPTNKTGF